MELDSLKYAWRTIEVRPAPSQSPEQIRALLERGSRGPVAKMRKNLLGEIILVLVLYTPAIFFYLFGFGGRVTEIAGLLSALLLLFGIYFYRKYKLLHDMQCLHCQVRSNLQRQVSALRRYIRFYTLTGTLMIPIMAILSFLILRWKLSTPGSALFYRLSGLPWWKDPVYWGLLQIPLTIGVYYVNTWYTHKLYGRHIRKLQEILDELEQGDVRNPALE